MKVSTFVKTIKTAENPVNMTVDYFNQLIDSDHTVSFHNDNATNKVS